MTSRLSELRNGFAPWKSFLARFAASMTSSKRFGTFCRQSSMVMRAMMMPQKGKGKPCGFPHLGVYLKRRRIAQFMVIAICFGVASSAFGT